MNKERLTNITITLPQESIINKWLEMQTNKSQSICELIKNEIIINGNRDLTKKEFVFPTANILDLTIEEVLRKVDKPMSLQEIEENLIEIFKIPSYALKLRYEKTNDLIFKKLVRFSRQRLVIREVVEPVKRGVIRIKV